MNIAICDDEEAIREQIKELVIKEKPGVCVELYETGDGLLAAGKQFDMVFLDIQMEGTDGIGTARKLRERDEDTILIFITGIREYVFEAFDVAAFHYLLKPVEEDKFREVFRRAERELDKRKKQQRETVFIKTRSRSFTLDADSILYVESRGKKVEVHAKGETIEAYVFMNEMEGQLGESFYRYHRGYLVNMAYVAEYDSEGITLNNGEYVYLAKEKYGEFVKAYMWYLRNGVDADD
ncbi:MAG: LytTR family DNA-binding domain-containing protein [Clostridium sp.]|nr:LytTR family DNA-binding domain-containing protein [Clostridium sp.]